MASKKTKIPTLHDQEERAFWNRHSVEEFGGERLDVVIQPTQPNSSPYD